MISFESLLKKVTSTGLRDVLRLNIDTYLNPKQVFKNI